jgi:hypothetical protein
MYIEDILSKLVGHHAIFHTQYPPKFLSPNELGLLTSFVSQIENLNGLSEKQATIAERILRSRCLEVSAYIAVDILKYLENPRYRLARKMFSKNKTAKLVTEANGVKQIALSFPYDEELVLSIKAKKADLFSKKNLPGRKTILWDPETRSWKFGLYEDLISWLNQTLINRGFTFDEDLQTYMSAVKEIEENVEKHIPMVVFEDNEFKYINVHKNIPQPVSTHLLEVLFEARKYGINTWDEHIDQALKDKMIGKLSRHVLVDSDFLRHDKVAKINPNDFTFSDFEDIIKYNDAAVIVIPGGAELESMRYCYQQLKNLGYTSEQLAAMFRVDGEKGKAANDFIKENYLNNPISEKVKIYFVSQKYPKPMIKNKVKVGTVITLGNTNPHNTLRNFINNHNTVFSYDLKKEKNGNL